jgi:hypothetical protein
LTGSVQIAAKGLASDGGGGATVKATKADKSTAATSVTFSGLGMLSQASVANAIRSITVNSPDLTYQRTVELSTGGVARLCDPSPAIAAGDVRKCTQ